MSSSLEEFLLHARQVLERLEPLLPHRREPLDWQHCYAARWRREGHGGYLQPLDVNLELRLSDLLGIDRQREQLARNTRQFVAGLPANHTLLWGARGTGKSSLIRALLAEYAAQGLRLIEIERDDLADLPRVVEQIAGQAQRFVLFCDDLSFDAGSDDYRVLKSVLDGSLEQAPDNVVLYATSNRRHLVARAAERQRQLGACRWRTAPERGRGGQDRLVGSLWPVVVLLSLHPGSLPVRGSALVHDPGRQIRPDPGVVRRG
ncbi:putative AAA+ superfamily ATPase [Pseudomonas psychrotolerans]|nr:putative AAA+ superfamily ATPase [Pseudomonas psychrotolerans]